MKIADYSTGSHRPCWRLLPLAWLLAVAAPVPATGRVTADGGWEAQGKMLFLGQRGSVKSSAPMRPVTAPPAGALVTSISWRIDTERPLPAGAMLAVCLPVKCVYLDGLSGRSDALAGAPANNPLTLLVKVDGSGAFYPQILLTRYQILVNYRTLPTR